MTFIVNILFSIISLILVFKAPDEYSYSYCVMVCLVFIIQNLTYFILRKDKNLVCVEFFFMIVFWLTNFVYPIFYYPTNPEFSVFNNPFNIEVITKSTSIAY